MGEWVSTGKEDRSGGHLSGLLSLRLGHGK